MKGREISKLDNNIELMRMAATKDRNTRRGPNKTKIQRLVMKRKERRKRYTLEPLA